MTGTYMAGGGMTTMMMAGYDIVVIDTGIRTGIATGAMGHTITTTHTRVTGPIDITGDRGTATTTMITMVAAFALGRYAFIGSVADCEAQDRGDVVMCRGESRLPRDHSDIVRQVRPARRGSSHACPYGGGQDGQ
jgi:hypothetical protein